MPKNTKIISKATSVEVFLTLLQIVWSKTVYKPLQIENMEKFTPVLFQYVYSKTEFEILKKKNSIQ